MQRKRLNWLKSLQKKRKEMLGKTTQNPYQLSLFWRQSATTTQPPPWVSKTIKRPTMGENGKASIRLIFIDGSAESSNTKDGRIIAFTTPV